MASLASPIALRDILIVFIFFINPLLLFLYPSLHSWVCLLCPKLSLPSLSWVGLRFPCRWSGLVNSVGSHSGLEVLIYLITASFYVFGFSCLIWFSSQKGSFCNISSNNNVSSADPPLACIHFLEPCIRVSSTEYCIKHFLFVCFFGDMEGCR